MEIKPELVKALAGDANIAYVALILASEGGFGSFEYPNELLSLDSGLPLSTVQKSVRMLESIGVISISNGSYCFHYNVFNSLVKGELTEEIKPLETRRRRAIDAERYAEFAVVGNPLRVGIPKSSHAMLFSSICEVANFYIGNLTKRQIQWVNSLVRDLKELHRADGAMPLSDRDLSDAILGFKTYFRVKKKKQYQISCLIIKEDWAEYIRYVKGELGGVLPEYDPTLE